MSEEETNTPAATPSSEGNPSSGAFNDLLKDIKDGERQKYDSVESALASINPAQEHIKRLEEENAQMKERLSEAKTVEALMAKLEESKATSQNNQSQSEQTFDMNKLREFVHSELSATEAQKAAKANVQKVMQAFQEKYGDKAPEVYNKMAEEAGVSGDFLRQMAETSPKAVLRLAGLEGSAQPRIPGKTENSVRSEGLSAPKVVESARVKMVGATSDELTNAWRATAAVVNS